MTAYLQKVFPLASRFEKNIKGHKTLEQCVMSYNASCAPSRLAGVSREK